MSEKQAKSGESKLQTMLRGLFGSANAEERDASLKKAQPAMRVANREVLSLLVRSGAESATVRERLQLVAKAFDADASGLNEECLGVALEVLRVTLHDLRERESELVASGEEDDSSVTGHVVACRSDWLTCAQKIAFRVTSVSNVALKHALFELLSEEAASAALAERRRSRTEDEQWVARMRALAQLSCAWPSVGEQPEQLASQLLALQRGMEPDSGSQAECLRLLREALQRSGMSFGEAELFAAVQQTCTVLQSTRIADCVDACFGLLETCVGVDRGGLRAARGVQGATCGCTARGELPLAALDELVRLLVQFACTDRFGRRAWSLTRRLLTADEPTALRCVTSMCEALYDAETSVVHKNHALLRGTVQCLSAAFWGRESVSGLRHLRPLVLPAFNFAAGSFEWAATGVDDCGFVLLANELVLALNRIGRAELLELSTEEWRVLLDLCDQLLSGLRFADGDAPEAAEHERDSLNVLFETHRLLRTASSLFAELRFVGDAARLFELLERAASCVAERRVRLGEEQRAALADSVCCVLQYRLAHECQMGSTGWLSSLRALMRQHALDAQLPAPGGRLKVNEVHARYRATLQLVAYLTQACANVQFVLFADELLTEALPFLVRALEHVRTALRSTGDADWAAHADAGWPLLEIVSAIVDYCCTTLARLALLQSPASAEPDSVRLLDRRAPQLLGVLEQFAAALLGRLAVAVDKDAPLFGEALEAELAARASQALQMLANRVTDLLRNVLHCAATSTCARLLFELVTLLLRSQLAPLVPAARARACAALPGADTEDEFADALDSFVDDAVRHTLRLPASFQSLRPADPELYRPLAARLETSRCTLLTFILELRSDRAAQRVGDARVLVNSHKLDYDLVEKLFLVLLEFECSVVVFEKLLCELSVILADRGKHSSEFVNALCKWVERWLTDKGLQQLQRFGFDQEQKRVSKELVARLQCAAFETILALIGHSAVLHVAQQGVLLRCLVDGLTSAGAGCRPLIVLGLIVSLYQIPRNVLLKQLSRAVIEMSKLLSSPQLAVLILEFLSHLRQQPALYDSFPQRQVMALFAMCVPYTAPAYHHFVVTFAYRSIVQWFVTCPLDMRRGFVSYILSSVQLNVKNAAATLDAARVNFHRLLYETCADLLTRFCFEQRTRDALACPVPSGTATAEHRLFLAGQCENWLVSNSLYSITTPGPARMPYLALSDQARRGSQPHSGPHSATPSVSQFDAQTAASSKRRHRSAVDSVPASDPSSAPPPPSSATSRVASTDDLAAISSRESVRSDGSLPLHLPTTAARCAELLIRRACGTTRCVLNFVDDNEPYGFVAPLTFRHGFLSDASTPRPEAFCAAEDEHEEAELDPVSTPTPASAPAPANVCPAEVLLRLFDPLTLSENALLLARDDATGRALKNLDRIPAFESHRIGVVYVAPGQGTNERAILSNTCGSRRYREFLERLGEFVRLRDLPAEYAGGLDTSASESDGLYTIVWNDTTVRVLFHVTTLMPTRSSDQQCNTKKLHVGNDYVLIVYDDSGAVSTDKFRIGTIGGQFGYANIIVEPLSDGMNAVTMLVKTELDDALGVAVAKRRCVHISDQNVAAFVRQVAVQVDLAALVFQKARTPHDPFASNFVERARQIARIRSKLLEKRPDSAPATDAANANARFLNTTTFLDFTSIVNHLIDPR